MHSASFAASCSPPSVWFATMTYRRIALTPQAPRWREYRTRLPGREERSPRPPGNSLGARHQDVDEVVDDQRDLDRVDRLKVDPRRRCHAEAVRCSTNQSRAAALALSKSAT